MERVYGEEQVHVPMPEALVHFVRPDFCTHLHQRGSFGTCDSSLCKRPLNSLPLAAILLDNVGAMEQPAPDLLGRERGQSRALIGR